MVITTSAEPFFYMFANLLAPLPASPMHFGFVMLTRPPSAVSIAALPGKRGVPYCCGPTGPDEHEIKVPNDKINASHRIAISSRRTGVSRSELHSDRMVASPCDNSDGDV